MLLGLNRTKGGSSPPLSTKYISGPLDTTDVALGNAQFRTLHPPHSRSVDSAAPAAAAPLPPCPLARLSLQHDSVLPRLPAPLGLASIRRGRLSLSYTHWHLVLLEDGHCGAQGLHAEIRGLLARAAGGKGSGRRGGGGDAGEGFRGGVGSEEVRLGEEAAQLEVLGE